MADLTPKQKAFVQEYLIDLNATQAAIRAGYSPVTASVIGSENLGKPYIQEAIQKAMAERAKRTEITADRVLHQLARQAFSDIRDFVYWDEKFVKVGETPEGEPIYEQHRVLRLKDASEVDGTLITEIREGQHGLVIKRTDPQKALELIGRHLALFTDKQEIKINRDPEEDAQIVNRLRELRKKETAGETPDPDSI